MLPPRWKEIKRKLRLYPGAWLVSQSTSGGTGVADQRIDALDGLRGAAIAYVMLGHFGPKWLDAAGSFGVMVFFALSGRLMADTLFINEMRWQEFAIRRFARLYPGLVFFLACTFILFGVVDQAGLFEDWWSYPIFAVNLVVVFASRFPPLDHLWSVSLEVQAYVLLALFSICLSGRGRLIALLVGAAFAFLNGLIRTYIWQQNPFMVYWRPDVGIAVIFCAAFMRLILKDVRVPQWLIAAAFGAANGLMLLTPEPWVSATLNGVLTACVAATVERSSSRMLTLLQSRPLLFLGTVSYSLYLWQQLFLYSHRNGMPLILALALSLLMATLSHYRVELPSKKLILSWWRRRTMPSPLGTD